MDRPVWIWGHLWCLAFGLSVLLMLVLNFPTSAAAGNSELLREWEKQKQTIKNQVVAKLKSEGKLPKDGVVRFTALVKPGRDKDRPFTVEIESLEVVDSADPRSRFGSTGEKGQKSSANDAEMMSRIFAPRSPAPIYTRGEIRFSEGRQTGEIVTLRSGLVGAAVAASGSPAKKAERVEPEVSRETSAAGQEADREGQPLLLRWWTGVVGWWNKLWH